MCKILQTACSAQYNEASTNISDCQYYLILRHFIKGTVHQKMQICLKCTHSQTIQNADKFVSSQRKRFGEI